MPGPLVPVLPVTLASPWMWPAAAEAAVARCDGHRATIVGTARGEIIKGTGGDDVIVGPQGNDIIRAPGRDTRPAEDISYDSISWDNSPHGVTIDLVTGIATGDGRDSFDARRAWVVGSRFGDVINGSSRDDLIQGGPGSDVLRGRERDDRIIADQSASLGGDDRVWGGRGRDQLTSSAGQDVVRGGRGDDVIDDVGNSADLLYGGRGTTS